MRTKKLLSVVLAALVVVGLFGVLGVAAQPATAQAGWPSTVTLTNRTDVVNRWDEAAIEWIGFAGAAGQNNSYVQQRAYPTTATVTWTATAFAANGNPIPLTIANNAATGALNPINVFTHSTSNGERLYIRQGRERYIGRVRVTIQVTANPTAGGAVPVTQTAFIDVTLVDQTEFSNLIARAERVLDNSNRYNDAYIATLRAFLEGARLYLSADITAPNVAQTVNEVSIELQRLLDDGPNNMRLWFINSPLLGRMVWGTVDFFATIGDALSPVVNFFTAMFGVFGPLVTLFSLLFGLFII